MNIEKTQDIKIKLRSFKILTSQFSIPPGKFSKKRTGEFSFQTKEKIEENKNLYRIQIDLELAINYRNKEHKIGHLITVSTYEIEGVKELKKNKIPNELIFTMYAISISTTRGAYAAESRGIIPSEITVPLIDPRNLAIIDDG